MAPFSLVATASKINGLHGKLFSLHVQLMGADSCLMFCKACLTMQPHPVLHNINFLSAWLRESAGSRRCGQGEGWQSECGAGLGQPQKGAQPENSLSPLQSVSALIDKFKKNDQVFDVDAEVESDGGDFMDGAPEDDFDANDEPEHTAAGDDEEFRSWKEPHQLQSCE